MKQILRAGGWTMSATRRRRPSSTRPAEAYTPGFQTMITSAAITATPAR
jgi:hypothetical protein